MALRRSSSGRYPRNDEDLDEEEVENNGYVQVFCEATRFRKLQYDFGMARPWEY